MHGLGGDDYESYVIKQFEDILDYNKLHEQYEQLQNTNVRENDDIMSYDGRWDLASNGVGLITNSGPPIESLPGRTAGSSRPCSFTLLSGLLGSSNSKHMPLKYAPLIVEIEVNSRNDDCIITLLHLLTSTPILYTHIILQLLIHQLNGKLSIVKLKLILFI